MNAASALTQGLLADHHRVYARYRSRSPHKNSGTTQDPNITLRVTPSRIPRNASSFGEATSEESFEKQAENRLRQPLRFKQFHYMADSRKPSSSKLWLIGRMNKIPSVDHCARGKTHTKKFVSMVRSCSHIQNLAGQGCVQRYQLLMTNASLTIFV